jgi:hypothetical protein
MATTDLELFSNSIGTIGVGTLASDPGSGGTTVTLTTGHGARFPAVVTGQRMRLQCENEIMICTAHTASADAFTVTRGAESTTAAAHAIGTTVNAIASAEAVRRWIPEYTPHPRWWNALAWTSSPLMCGGTFTPTAGKLYVGRAYAPEQITVTNMRVYVGAGTGATALANCFMGLYTSAGTRIAVSNDMSTDFATTGDRVTTSLTVDGGQSLTFGGPGVYVWVALVVGTQSTTALTVRQTSSATSAGQTNMGLTAASPFFGGNSGTGLTALPTTFTPTALSSDVALMALLI